MPGTGRERKRRRASGDDLHPSTPSKRTKTQSSPASSSAKRSRKRDAAVDDLFDKPLAVHSPKRSTDHPPKPGSPTKRNYTPRTPSCLRTDGRLVEIHSDELGEDETNSVADRDESDEPRRSSRKRKPTAKVEEGLLHAVRVKSLSNTPKTPVTTPGKRSKSLFTPSSVPPLPASEVQSSSPQARRPRGRPPKAKKGRPPTTTTKAIQSRPGAEGRQNEVIAGLNSTKVAPLRIYKRSTGPPQLSQSQSNAVEDDILAESSPPDITPKARRRGRPRKLRDPCSSDDLADLLSNGVSKSLPKPDDSGTNSKSTLLQKSLKGIETLDPVTYSALIDIVIEKLCQRRSIPLTGLEDEYSKVYKLVEATVVAGEGNSMLVIGARGTGKTALVNKVLTALSRTERENFHIVRLNGLIQTDDKLALREIWRQLGREMEIDEEAGKSYADTLIMLLALLSHPEEISGQTGDQVAKSVIFVLDEFDLFATHARQTLLYNLLDIAQSRKAPIAILGLTTKFDVTESLEKRVKSRFSHRYVHLPLPKSLGSFHDICKAACSIQQEELTFEENALISREHEKNSKRSKPQGTSPTTHFEIWNSAVENLFADPAFNNQYIRPTYHLTKAIPTVLSSLIIPFTTLLSAHASSAPILPATHFVTALTTATSLQPPPSTLPLTLPYISDLQLGLLIAAARLSVIHASDACSLAMAYEEYVALASRARLQHPAAARVWSRDVARAEWEALLDLGLLIPVVERAGTANAAAAAALVRVDVALEEIPGWVPDISTTMEKWCRQI